MTNKLYTALACAALVAACDGGKAPTTINLGKPAHAADFEIAVTSVDQISQIDDSGVGPTAEKGEAFVVVRYTLKNISKKPIDKFSLPTVALVDEANVEYAPDGLATTMAIASNPNLQSSGDINPNLTSKQVAVWRLNETAFNRATWRLKVSLDDWVSRQSERETRWPLRADTEPLLMFKLK